jgi:mRNA-degrading endonuclease RelE of RelBE toxin-antitoxin system
MKIRYNPIATRAFADAPSQIQKAFLKQAGFLVQNLHHPSLRAKKYDEAEDYWQARVNRDWRFYFTIEDDTYVILDRIPHAKNDQAHLTGPVR